MINTVQFTISSTDFIEQNALYIDSVLRAVLVQIQYTVLTKDFVPATQSFLSSSNSYSVEATPSPLSSSNSYSVVATPSSQSSSNSSSVASTPSSLSFSNSYSVAAKQSSLSSSSNSNSVAATPSSLPIPLLLQLNHLLFCPLLNSILLLLNHLL